MELKPGLELKSADEVKPCAVCGAAVTRSFALPGEPVSLCDRDAAKVLYVFADLLPAASSPAVQSALEKLRWLQAAEPAPVASGCGHGACRCRDSN